VLDSVLSTLHPVLRLLGWIALVAALVVLAGGLLPLAPEFLHEQLDASFGATLHFGAATGAPLISTFGPLGFVFYPIYFPATFAWLFGLRAALAAATGWALGWLGYAAWDSPWGGAVAILVCAPFLAVEDVWLLTLPLLAALFELPRRRPPLTLQWALGAAIGLAALIKFTVLTAAVLVFVPLTAAELWQRRRLPAVVVAALVAIAIGWAATGHGVGAAVRYVDWSVRDIAAGYSSGMQLPANRELTIAALAVSTVVFAAGVALAWWRRRRRMWRIALVLAGTLGLLFRTGFVRADVHVYITCYGLLVIAALLALLAGPRPLAVLCGAALTALLPGWLWWKAERTAGPPTLYFPITPPLAALRNVLDAPVRLRADTLARGQARAVATIRGANPLPPLPGGVDVYSYAQAVLLAHDVDFRPRPVFQSYMAYTPRLAQANAAFLLDSRAPEWILFRVEPIDRGMPSLDDAASWPLLLTRYRFERSLAHFALLQRRAVPLTWALAPLGLVETTTNTRVAVPAGVVWARIDLHDTFADRALRTLFTGPLVYLDLIRRDGRAQGFRLVPALARDGFLLSPPIENTLQFTQFASAGVPPGDASEVVSLLVRLDRMLEVEPEARPVSVEFFQVTIR